MPRYYLLYLIPLAIFLLPVLAAVVREAAGGKNAGRESGEYDEDEDEKEDEDPPEAPRVVITQRVPSVFEAFKDKETRSRKK